ncbi:CehA/McbA family metallohydrolase [Actinoplanes missouriensis]|uniref:CehA/McbA family metallohydrolase n=1 Tax=Actinoplanes missouriensis TaxID=1866 RepID=UPI000314BF11|nr:CehA/McbA family metallohydrolase [Actinoplanes missouriensis]
MDALPFHRPGRFWRGNLHTHSDRSDGALPPEEVARRYRDAGYDFLAITDHFRERYGFPLTDTRSLRVPGFTTLIGAELHPPRTEFSAEWHILAVGLPLGFAPPGPEESDVALTRRARDAGAFIGIAHPAASLLTAVDAERLDAAHAVEAYNALSVREDRGDSWHLTDVLVNRGHRLTAYAADDAHFQPQDPPGCRAWVQVRAEELTPEALLAALKAGHYYSSTGPEIHDVRVGDGAVHVSCSAARKVMVTGGDPGVQLIEGLSLTEGSLPVAMFRRGWCRVTVEDAEGNRAWTNPFRLAPSS